VLECKGNWDVMERISTQHINVCIKNIFLRNIFPLGGHFAAVETLSAHRHPPHSSPPLPFRPQMRKSIAVLAFGVMKGAQSFNPAVVPAAFRQAPKTSLVQRNMFGGMFGGGAAAQKIVYENLKGCANEMGRLALEGKTAEKSEKGYNIATFAGGEMELHSVALLYDKLTFCSSLRSSQDAFGAWSLLTRGFLESWRLLLATAREKTSSPPTELFVADPPVTPKLFRSTMTPPVPMRRYWIHSLAGLIPPLLMGRATTEGLSTVLASTPTPRRRWRLPRQGSRSRK